MAVGEPYLGRAGRGVLGDVGECLLHDPVGREVRPGGKRPWFSLAGEGDSEPDTGSAEIVELSLVSRDGTHEPLVEEFLRHAATDRQETD